MRAQTRAVVSRKHLIQIVVAGVAGLALTAAVADPPRGDNDRRVEVTHLAIDGRGDDPIGVDDVVPRLSWQVTMSRGWTQAAYQIRAARTIAELVTGPYLWDSGKSARIPRTTFPGVGLHSGPARQSRGKSGRGAPAATRRRGVTPPRGRWGCLRAATGATPCGSNTRGAA
jgi:alpha-L-rhamnosidase